MIRALLILLMTVSGIQAAEDVIGVRAKTNGPLATPLGFFFYNIIASNGITITHATNGVNAGAIAIGADTGYYILSNSGKGTNINFYGVTETHGALVGDSTASFTDLITGLNGIAIFNGATIFAGLTVSSGAITGDGSGVTNLATSLTNSTHFGLRGTGLGLATLSPGFAIGLTNEARTNIAIAVIPSDIPLYSLSGVGPTFASLVDGQVLVYNAAAGKWTNGTATAALATNALSSFNGMTNYSQYLESTENSNNVVVSFLTGTNRINIPAASATKTGKLSSNDWTSFNGKISIQGGAGNANILTNATNFGTTWIAANHTTGLQTNEGNLNVTGLIEGWNGLLIHNDTLTAEAGLGVYGSGNVFSGDFNMQNTGKFAGNANGLTNLPTSLTNSTHYDMRAGSRGLKTLSTGLGVLFTNETGGTNLVIAINPSIVATQANLMNLSNSLLNLTFDSALAGQVPFYGGGNAFSYDSRFSFNSSSLGMLSFLRWQFASNSLTVPVAADLGVGGARIWNSNGTVWASCSTNGTTIFHQQLVPLSTPYSRMLFSDTTATVSTGGGASAAYTIAANTLVKNGDRLKVKFSGAFSADNPTRQLAVFFGSDNTMTTFDAGTGSASKYYTFDVEVIRSGASAQIINTSFRTGATGFDAFTTTVAGTQNTTSTIIVRLEMSSNVIQTGTTNMMTSVEYWPGP